MVNIRTFPYFSDHEVSKRTMLELIFNSTDFFEYLHMTTNDSVTPWILDFFVNPPSDGHWIKIKDSQYDIDDILKYQTLINVLDDEAKRFPTEPSLRWQNMNPLWDRAATRLVSNVEYKKVYLKAMYEQTLKEGAQYLETRKNFGEAEMLYEIDPTDTTGDGKKYLDNNEGALEINITLQVLEEFQKVHPEFIGHRRITYSVRVLDPEVIKDDMRRAVKLHNLFPDHFIGYDMVAEEDGGNSLQYYLKQFLELYKAETADSAVPLYLHTAETNLPADLIPSPNDNDPVATIENIYDAILLGAKRIGHGLGVFKHPYLMKLLKDNDVAVEVCPVSNQILGFVPDLRSHPAQNYYHNGIPIVLGADDPGTFGVDSFAIDWYEIYLAWGLDLGDLRTIARNSLDYSGMSDIDKDYAINNKWLPAWNSFINDIYDEACDAELKHLEPLFASVLPTLGATTGTTKVHIFGRHFERAICQDVTCHFGNVKSSSSKYISNIHILCEAPDVSTMRHKLYAGDDDIIFDSKTGDILVEIKINLGDNIIREVGQNFTYKYASLISTTPSPNTGSGITSQGSFGTLLAFIFAYMFLV